MSDINNSQLDILNPSHDLFLHSSDNPNNILVNELLNGKNYGTWKKSVEIALIAKNKLGFVLGTCSKPDATSPMLNQWNRCDKMVIFWLLHARAAWARLGGTLAVAEEEPPGLARLDALEGVGPCATVFLPMMPALK